MTPVEWLVAFVAMFYGSILAGAAVVAALVGVVALTVWWVRADDPARTPEVTR